MYQKYLNYIKNTGGKPKITHFDEDWEPIGPQVRKAMVEAKLIYEQDGLIYLAEAVF